jgi:hypothetical protein
LISKKKTVFINFKIHFSIEKFSIEIPSFLSVFKIFDPKVFEPYLHPIKGPFHLKIVSSFFFIEMSLDSRSIHRSSFITFLTKILNYENDILVFLKNISMTDLSKTNLKQLFTLDLVGLFGCQVISKF